MDEGKAFWGLAKMKEKGVDIEWRPLEWWKKARLPMYSLAGMQSGGGEGSLRKWDW